MDKISVIANFEAIETVNLLFATLEEMATKINEIVEVINSLKHDNHWMTPIQHRGGIDA